MLNIIPAPSGRYEALTGSFTLPQRYGMAGVYPESDRVFTERVSGLGDFYVDKDSSPVIFFERVESLKDESYRLRVDENKVIIYAGGECGYFYGLTTLYQMLVMGNGTIPNGSLSDFPRFQRRGAMLDVCRHFFCVEEIKRLLEQMSLLKMNQFHWHLSDDQGFRIESEQFPELNKISAYRRLSPDDPLVKRGLKKAGDMYGGYYTKDQIREVIDYARVRGIDVIPEIDLPGHSSAVLSVFPGYTCSGEPLRVKGTFGIHERIFCAGNEEIYPFLYTLLDEVCELFPSPYIHIGGDEAPKGSWKSCPACKKLMEEKGFTSYEKLQTFFTSKLIDHVKQRGKTPVVWNESAISGDLDGSAVIQYWAEMAPGPSYVVPELAKGRKLILSCSDQFYCTPSYADLPLKATLMYEPQIKDVPVPDENVLGIEAAMWTEWSPENADIEKAMYPRLLAVSECAWTKKRDYDSFMLRAHKYLEYAPLNLFEPTPWAEATICGPEALKQIAVNMLELGARYRGMSEYGDEAGGKAEAVLPDGAGPMDMAAMARKFVEDKMKAAYTPEEIDQVVEMISGMMQLAIH